MSQVEIVKEACGQSLQNAILEPFGITEEDVVTFRNCRAQRLVDCMEELASLESENPSKLFDPEHQKTKKELCDTFYVTEKEYIIFLKPEAEIIDDIRTIYDRARQLVEKGADSRHIGNIITEEFPCTEEYLHFLDGCSWWAYKLGQALIDAVESRKLTNWLNKRPPHSLVTISYS